MFHNGDILPPVKKSLSRGEDCPSAVCRGLCTQRDRLILTSSQVLSCLLSAGCGKSGVSHISLAKMWGRGESNQEVRFHNRSKVRELVRKRVPPQSESEGSRRLLWMCHLCHQHCEGDSPSAPCAAGYLRHCWVTWGSAGPTAGSSLRKLEQVHAGQTKGALHRLSTLYSSSKGQPLPAAPPGPAVADKFQQSPGSWQVLGLMFYKIIFWT